MGSGNDVRPNLYYSKEHEWAEVKDSRTVRIGITDFAQCELGDVVFVELPEPGRSVQAKDSIGTLESVKAVSDLYSPISGTVVKVNEALLEKPESVNEDPYGAGWMVEIEVPGSAVDTVSQLLTAKQYKESIE